jgi:hypothetical protein
LPIVFALAGDSTMTSDVEPGSDACSLSSIRAALFRALAGLALLAVDRFEALFAAVVFLAVLAFAI